jgi:hypothetical protein
MALVISVAKVSVTKPQEGMYAVTLNLTCSDGPTEVINQNFSKRKRPDVSWNTVGLRMIGEMQAAIDKYKETEAIFTSAAMDSAVTQIQGMLVG